MDNYIVGFCVGVVACYIIERMVMKSYKRILVMKSQDRTAECINGKFYYIVPEEEKK